MPAEAAASDAAGVGPRLDDLAAIASGSALEVDGPTSTDAAVEIVSDRLLAICGLSSPSVAVDPVPASTAVAATDAATGTGPARMADMTGSSPVETGTPIIPPNAGPPAAAAAAVGGENRTVVRRSEAPTGSGDPGSRRSAGPPRAGSGPAAVKASSASVDDRRGIAS